MTLVSPELKQAMEKLYEDLKSNNDPSKSARPSVAVAKMIGPQSSEARWNDLVIRSDESPAVGGAGSAPPLRLFSQLQ
jgi:hypothetical protein